MDRLMFRRLEWAVRRGWMLHGAMGALAMISLFVAGMLMLRVVSDYRRVVSLEREVSARAKSTQLRRSVSALSDAPDEAPAFPAASQRSLINGKILAILDRFQNGPEQVRFKFEASSEAGLVRQVAVFNIKATWPEIAGLLHKLQMVDRSVYVSRLKITREGDEESLVDAEIQLGLITDVLADEVVQP